MEEANKYPILFLPSHSTAERAKRNGRGSTPMHPSRSRQSERIGPKFENLRRTMERESALFKSSSDDIVPEQILVFELAGTIKDFRAATLKIGMDWLGEAEFPEAIEPDEDFFLVNSKGEKKDNNILKKIFFVCNNQSSMKELTLLWSKWSKGITLPYGFGDWSKIFELLHDVRIWGTEDRLSDTGLIEDWYERVSYGQETVKFEIELWYRSNTAEQDRASNLIFSEITELNGKVLTHFIHDGIGYHGMLGEIPIEAVNKILDKKDVNLVKCQDVMFFRPLGQCGERSPDNDLFVEEIDPKDEIKPLESEPIVALLDGLPLQNHNLLKGWIIVDDPDDWENDYLAHQRLHGTSMASLIIHGDLSLDEDAITSPVYTRPILKPNNLTINNFETIPEDSLPLDIIHKSVVRIFEGEGSDTPAAPSISIINLSIGDPERYFSNVISSWSRMLDWLSWRYDVLFIISAGNHLNEIELNAAKGTIPNINLEDEVVLSIAKNARHRRLLSPAESINNITVGATYSDGFSGIIPNPHAINVIKSEFLASPISAQGLGYRRSIKPDIMFCGGRLAYQEKFHGGSPNVVLTPILNYSPPGQRVATPGQISGDIDKTIYTSGTSNATALATRAAEKIITEVRLLKGIYIESSIDDAPESLIAKTLLVHGAHWGEAGQFYNRLFKPNVGGRKIKEFISRFIGYGSANIERVLEGAKNRATLIGASKISEGEGHIYKIPLPSSLSSKAEYKRLTITLSWYTPIRPSNQIYRKAQLWFNPLSDNKLGVSRTQNSYDHNSVLRGTIQHEILEGDKAAVYSDGDVIALKVSCREDAPHLDVEELIPYSIAVTLETAIDSEIEIFEEISNAIRPSVRV